jgi:hypothetical protein
MTVDDTVRQALATEPSEEAQARHLEQIHEAIHGGWAPSKDAWDSLLQGLAAHWKRMAELESFRAQAEFQIINLTEQMQAVVESQKREDTEAYKALRRSILALALAEVLNLWGWQVDEVSTDGWDQVCAEVYRRYGGPELGLWLNPPDHVSDKTRALVKLFLQRRQEA